jgi:hypothetical protein
MGSSEKQVFHYFHGVPVAPLRIIGPGGYFHFFERALLDTGAAVVRHDRNMGYSAYDINNSVLTIGVGKGNV